ncbi:MAG: Penicillin amidase, partial [Solirubrobacterales bacterium]|nr:Penicillin amidase [Solirubrobacterales bacterium]
MRLGRLLAVLTLALAAAAPAAQAQGPFGDAGGFNSVLAIGAGTGVTATDLVQNLATGATPFAFEDQRAQYSAISRTIDGLTTGTLGRGWKPSSFRTAEQDADRVDTPRPGVRIVRDAAHPYPRVYGTTRSDLMFGTGYATAQDRLFLMDVLRHTAEASTVELLGPSAAEADAAQLRVQDFSPSELRQQFDALDDTFGAAGAKGQQDYVDYVAGINAFMDAARTDPGKLPAEYPALGVNPRSWTIEDSLATAVL